MLEWTARVAHGEAVGMERAHRACRSSGKLVKVWYEENGINVKNYCRWKRLYIAEASARIQLPAGQGEGAAALVRIEPTERDWGVWMIDGFFRKFYPS